MEIHKTTDYDSFRNILSNREVDKAHVKRLANSIEKRNLLYIRPCIVNEKKEVIDGQHRIEACRMIGQPVYYIIAEKLSKDDIAILNTAQKNWTRLDFINFYAIEGRPEYKQLAKLINKYPHLKVSTLISLAGAGDSGTKVRDGYLDVRNIAHAHEVCGWITDLLNLGYKFVCERDFGKAFNREISSESAFASLLSKVNPENFYKCSSEPEYRKMLSWIA